MTNTPTTGEPVPIVCIGDPNDTEENRLAEFSQLSADALVGREHTVDGFRFRFRADAGIEDRVRDLAAKEKRCCAFFQFNVTATGGEVLWDCTVLNDGARLLLEDYYSLPDIADLGVDAVRELVVSHGLTLAYDT